MSYDEKDEEIISLLKKNSRMSNIEISKKIGMTEGAVRSRIKKLVDSGTISKFTIEVKAPSNNYAVVMVKAETGTKKMMNDILKLGIHSDAYEISGEYDGCIILEASSINGIDKKIDEIRKLKSVSDTRTFISFRRW
jgi:DNA-binding Lrp family transcriptional regulator